MANIKVKKLIKIIALIASSTFVQSASAQQVLRVSQAAWFSLTQAERDLIQLSYIASTVAPEAFGVIIDNQGVNESTSGTNGGAILGSALANASYIDNALRGGRYSAVNQLAAGIFGAVIGSTLDSKAKVQYHYRYAVKLGSGNIQYFDEVSGYPFRHPAGICVSVPHIGIVEQQLCTQTAATLRATYLQQPAVAVVSEHVAPPAVLQSQATSSPIALPIYQAVQFDATSSSLPINCKLGSLAPVRTSPEKCNLIKGSQVP